MSDSDKENGNVMRTGDQIRFAGDILKKQLILVRQIERRSNVALGFSGLILTFAIGSLGGAARLEMGVISVAAAVSIALCLMSLKPPRFLSQKHQRQSLFYHTAIAAKSSDEYVEKVKSISEDLDRVLEQYALETYNLVKHSVIFKKRFAHSAITVLTVGCLLGVLVFLARIV